MVDLPKGSAERSFFFALHKSIGLTTGLLLLARVGWRIFHRAPALPPSLRRWQALLAHGTHALLYLFMFVQPLSGYLSSSYSGYSTRFWGLALPQWAPQDTAINELFTEIHVVSSVALLCLATLHVLGAFGHVFSVHASVLQRMLPGVHGDKRAVER
jgi:cytochrome b561